MNTKVNRKEETNRAAMNFKSVNLLRDIKRAIVRPSRNAAAINRLKTIASRFIWERSFPPKLYAKKDARPTKAMTQRPRKKETVLF